ncbi:hypothetical protein ANO11243_076860 [Dothideomycetidae sp. 11243]|nr:hypothetical protein ANO11243_076860 [fungal sp. No.11243]
MQTIVDTLFRLGKSAQRACLGNPRPTETISTVKTEPATPTITSPARTQSGKRKFLGDASDFEIASTGQLSRDKAASDRGASTSPTRKKAKVEVASHTRIPVQLLDDSEDDTPQPRAQKTVVANATVNMSFQSTSSLSTALPSSQLSTMSSSQRIWKNGEQMVTNSSSEAEEMESIAGESSAEDDEEVDDIELLIFSKQRELAAKKEEDGTRAGVVKIEEEYLPRHLRRNKPKPPPPKSYPTPPRNAYKHSLAAMLQRRKQDAAVESRLEALREEDRDAQDELDVPTMTSSEDNDISAEQANIAITGLDDPDGRVKLALDRMDALQREVHFHFFDQSGPQDVSRTEFPESDDVRWDPWVRLLGEDDEKVCDAYARLLVECGRHDSPKEMLNIETLQNSLIILGARRHLINPTLEPLRKAHAQDGECPPKRFHNLSSLISFLAAVSPSLDSCTRDHAIRYISLLLADTTVIGNIVLHEQVRSCFCTLLATVSDADFEPSTDTIAASILAQLKDAILVWRVVSVLPMASHDERAAVFARRLAFAYLTGQTPPTTTALIKPDTWTTIHSIIASESFSISDKTDYAALAARVRLLSTAIGPGFSDFTFLSAPPTVSSPLASADREEGKASSFFIPRTAPAPPKSKEETDFNAAAIKVGRLLRDLAARIRDGGAAHMRRTECKARIEGLAARIEGCVATAVPRRRVFGP